VKRDAVSGRRALALVGNPLEGGDDGVLNHLHGTEELGLDVGGNIVHGHVVPSFGRGENLLSIVSNAITMSS